MLTERDKELIRELQKGLPLVNRPFKVIADKLKMSEEDLINRIRFFIENGEIRRFGAAVRHHDLGYLANAMVVWDAPSEEISRIGKMMAGFDEVTHCYQRPRFPGWPYNLFTVVHGHSREECIKAAGEISRVTGLDRYCLLFSSAELKKSSMRYFE